MQKITLTLVAATLITGGSRVKSIAGNNYVYGGDNYTAAGKDSLPSACELSYNYVDAAYLYSDYASAVAPGVLTGRIQRAPNVSIVDKMKGVDIAFSKSINETFHLTGEFYNTDGGLTPSLVAASPVPLTGVRAELYYYRLGGGAHHSLSGNLDFTFEVGGLYADSRLAIKLEDEWGWYVSPGLRYRLGHVGELYGKYSYENYERIENHRFDGGLLVPVKDCLSVKLGGRHETSYDKTSLLAGFRFNY